jgi:hypothetical protein
MPPFPAKVASMTLRSYVHPARVVTGSSITPCGPLPRLRVYDPH